QDQKRIFDIQYNSGRNPKPGGGAETAMEIGSIQMQMVRRGLEMKTLREEIARLEVALGVAGQSTAAPGKSAVRLGSNGGLFAGPSWTSCKWRDGPSAALHRGDRGR